VTGWTISFYCEQNTGTSSVQCWLDERNTHQLKAIAKELKLLQLCGNTLRLPHSKALGESLFELRERSYGYRIYYTYSRSQNIILLEAGNKSTQRKDIKIARERLLKVSEKEKRDETEKI